MRLRWGAFILKRLLKSTGLFFSKSGGSKHFPTTEQSNWLNRAISHDWALEMTTRQSRRQRVLSAWYDICCPSPAGYASHLAAWAPGARSSNDPGGRPGLDGQTRPQSRAWWRRGIDLFIWKPSAWGAGRLTGEQDSGQSQLSERCWRGSGAGGSVNMFKSFRRWYWRCFCFMMNVLMHFRLYDCLLPDKIQ